MSRVATLFGIVTARFAFLHQAVGVALRAWAIVALVSVAASAALAKDAAPPPAAPPQDVSGAEMSMLIRTTMVALHQANLTGNYTVLRDLGAGVLRASNSAADLAVRFAEFRQRGFNLAPTVLFDAVLDEKPKLTTDGQLQLVGHFPTKPQEVIFDLTFRYEVGAWRIALLQVGSRMAVASADAAKPAEAGVPKPKAAAEGLIPPTKPVPLPRVRPKP